jgi:RNA polymerase II elongation factor ELL
MPILEAKNRNAVVRRMKMEETKPKPKPKPKPRGVNETEPRNGAPKPVTQAEKEQADIDALRGKFHQAEAEKLENRYVHRHITCFPHADPGYSTGLIEGISHVKRGKLARGSKAKLLQARPSSLPTSHPGSPALSGIGSPSLGPTSGSQAQDKVKKLRFPLIHELAVGPRAFDELLAKWDGGNEADLHTHVEKVAHFDDSLQKWALNKPYWKELDVYAYPYDKDEDRHKAIDNAIKHYDKVLRLSVSDPLWQKLLPKEERGKGKCLSRVQAAIANGPIAPAPKISIQKAEASSPSVDSEREDSGSSSNKKAKGGEPMARSNSGNKTKKMSEAQAQAKRLMSNKPSSKPSSAKSSPKVSPTKPAPKAAAGKGGRVLSKEFISDSDSDSTSEEVPLSKTTGTTAATNKEQRLKELADNLKAKPKPKLAERATEKPKPVEKARDVPAPKPKPAAAKPAPASKVMDSIRAEVVAKPVRPAKRSRDEDDDSSSSGTPLSKRFKAQDQAPSKPQPTQTKHRKSDASQNSRGSSSAVSSTKVKTSPVKSSPLASSPPTNASDMDPADRYSTDTRETREMRDTIVASKKRKLEPTYHEKNDTSDSSNSAKRTKYRDSDLPPGVREQAVKFKSYYARYEALHRELTALEDPPENRVADLVDMHQRLSRMKQKIRDKVGYASD